MNPYNNSFGNRVPQQPGYQGPGAPYGEPRDNGWTWNPGAGQQFSQENGFDPTTGMPVGPGALPPANIAMQWQAEHDRRVWQYRQNLMRSAHGYASGALGLLESFRPGGSSAIEAGQYNTLAGIQMQRAGMTQPLNLMGDYVRDEQARARMASNRQAERQLAVQGAAAIAGLAGAFFTGGATLAMLPGIMGSMASQAGGAGGGRYQQPGGGYGPTAAGAGGAPQQPGGAGAPGGAPRAPGGVAPTQPGSQPGTQAGLPGPTNQQPITSPGGGQGGQALASTLTPPGGGGDGPGAAGGQPGGADGPGAPGGGMGAGPSVGSDGNFAPVAFAARAAAMGGGDPLHTLAITRMVADELESDPIWQRLAIGVDQRLASRLAS